jgi:hypothetical protein
MACEYGTGERGVTERRGVGVSPARDHQAMTDDEVLDEARADGFELEGTGLSGRLGLGLASWLRPTLALLRRGTAGHQLDARPHEPRAHIRLVLSQSGDGSAGSFARGGVSASGLSSRHHTV